MARCSGQRLATTSSLRHSNYHRPRRTVCSALLNRQDQCDGGCILLNKQVGAAMGRHRGLVTSLRIRSCSNQSLTFSTAVVHRACTELRMRMQHTTPAHLALLRVRPHTRGSYTAWAAADVIAPGSLCPMGHPRTLPDPVVYMRTASARQHSRAVPQPPHFGVCVPPGPPEQP